MIPRLAASAAAGWLLTLAFQPTGWWIVAVPAIAVLIGCCYQQRPGRAFLVGAAFGLAFHLVLLNWLAPVIGADAWVGLSLYSGAWLGVTGTGIALVSRTRLWWLWAACIWVLVEAISGRIPFGGWAWGRVGFSQDASPLLPWAALAGVPGLTFAVVLTAAAVAALVLRAGRGAGSWATPVLAMAAIWVIPLAIAVPTHPESVAGPATRQVGLVQGNVPQAGLDFNSQRRQVLDNHVRQTMELAQDVADGTMAAPDFVLWPENASDIDPFQNADANAAIDAAARSVAVPLLVGAVVHDPDDPSQVFNQGIVWDPVTGPGESYTKRNLVPFGEYLPFRDLLASRISRFDRVPRDFVPGDEPGDLAIGGTRIADALCFDVAYDDALRQATRQGGRMLVVQTNNATYNGTSQPFQQFAMSRIRAVEHGRAVAVVATAGLSGVIAPDGSLVPGSAVGELVPGRYVLQIGQRDTLTVSDRLGPVPEWAIAALGALAIAAGVRDRRVAKSTSAGSSSAAQTGRPQAQTMDVRPKGRT